VTLDGFKVCESGQIQVGLQTDERSVMYDGEFENGDTIGCGKNMDGTVFFAMNGLQLSCMYTVVCYSN